MKHAALDQVLPPSGSSRVSITSALPGKALVAACLLSGIPLFAAAPDRMEISSTWPEAYSVQQNKRAGRLVLATPYYQVQHDLRRGGAICEIRLTHGKAANLLLTPMETRICDEQNRSFSDLNDGKPLIKHIGRNGLTELVEVDAKLARPGGATSGIRVKTRYEYHWGYIKVHREFTRGPAALRAREVCGISTVLSPTLAQYGYREGVTEQEKAPPFSFGSCVWGKFSAQTKDTPFVKTRQVPRYVMFADPGVEGFEWFVSSDLSQWESRLTGRRGQGQFLLQRSMEPAGTAWSVCPVQSSDDGTALPVTWSLDYYIGVPLLEGHARQPWLHASFNRNRGDWVSADQVRQWAQNGIQTVHCHNDGDYYDDGLFWRDGSYPPYPDMNKYDQVIAACHQAGIRVATYFSNKELHPSTTEFQEHGVEWGRRNAKGDLQHNFYRGTNEFGAQMCLRSGWLGFLKHSIDRVLSNHQLDRVYYDWNVALLCCNGGHEGQAGPGEGHWDIDQLLDLMEWTRSRVGPKGLIIVHNTTTPMFVTENFADYVVANEWGYGKWNEHGPESKDLPLEWSLVGARSRGVISYGQLDSKSPARLHRLFALEALVSGVTPWPAGAETFDVCEVLKPIGALNTCRFMDWRNPAVTVTGNRCASTVYSRFGEAFIVLANLNEHSQRVLCKVRLEALPFPIATRRQAALFDGHGKASSTALDVSKLTSEGVDIELPADSAVLIKLR